MLVLVLWYCGVLGDFFCGGFVLFSLYSVLDTLIGEILFLGFLELVGNVDYFDGYCKYWIVYRLCGDRYRYFFYFF